MMAPTPQTNATLAQIAQALREHDNYIIVGHVSPDGDCIGSQLALKHALHRLGKKAQCVLATDALSVDTSLGFLPGVHDMVPAAELLEQMVGACESTAPAAAADAASPVAESCVITVDVPNHERMGQAAASLHKRASFTITLDHHANKEAISTLNYVDPNAASNTLNVWQLIGELGVDRSGDVALCAFTGLVTDTGRFQYQNANPFAFRCAAEMLECGADLEMVCTQIFQRRSIASLQLENRAIARMELLLGGALAVTYITLDDFACVGAAKTDADNIVNTLRSIDGVRVACTLRETEENVRGSLRSKDGTDIAVFAFEHGGGGHKAAAGMTLKGAIVDVFAQVKEELCVYLQEMWKEQ